MPEVFIEIQEHSGGVANKRRLKVKKSDPVVHNALLDMCCSLLKKLEY